MKQEKKADIDHQENGPWRYTYFLFRFWLSMAMSLFQQIKMKKNRINLIF